MAARSVLVLIGICGAKMLVYMMVLAWILPVDGRLDASILFPAMALYQQLRSAFFSRVSMAVQYTGEAMATLRRVQVSRPSSGAFTLTKTETDKKWLKYDCVEVFMLHRDTNAIGYCSLCIFLCLSIDLGLCWSERSITHCRLQALDTFQHLNVDVVGVVEF